MRIVNASSREIERVAGFRWVPVYPPSLHLASGRGTVDLQPIRSGWTLFANGLWYKVKVVAPGLHGTTRA